MARGSIVWRCSACGTGKARGECRHAGAQYSIIYPVQRWDAAQARIVKGQKWERAGTNKDDAETLLAEKLKQVHEGSYRDLQEITFAAFADKWLTEYARGHVKPSTYQAYESHIRAHLKPTLGALTLQVIREDTIQGYCSAKLTAGLRPKSVKNHLLILKTMLRHAVRWGYLVANPAAEVKPPRIERQEMATLTPAAVAHLLTARDDDGEPAIRPGWYVPIKLAIFSGLRQGEQFALRIGDLDFTQGQVRVSRGVTWLWKKHTNGAPRYHFSAPKSKSGVRNVDLPPDLLEDLHRYVAGLPNQDPDRLLFATSTGTPLDPKNVVDRVFRVALSRAKLPRIRWHDLRHTYASLQLAAGANIKYLSQQMGHASVQITLDRYSHLLQDSHPAQAAKLSALVFDSPRANALLTDRAGTRRNTTEQQGRKTLKDVAQLPANMIP